MPFGGEQEEMVKWEIHVSRGWGVYLINYILPINMCSLISYTTYWTDPIDEDNTRQDFARRTFTSMTFYLLILHIAMPPTTQTPFLLIYVSMYFFVIFTSMVTTMYGAMREYCLIF